MHPYLGDTLAMFPLFLALGIGAGAFLAVHLAPQAGIGGRRLALVILLCAATALIGAKLYSLAERGVAWSPAWEVVYGYRYPGGIAGLLIAILALGRWGRLGISAAALGDLFAPCLVFSMAVVRIGCFLGGCCFGTPSEVPWAVAFPAGSKAWEAQRAAGLIGADAAHSLPVHPLQLYFVLECLGIGAALLWLQRRKRYDGQVLLVYLMLHGTTRVALDVLRFEHLPHLQWTSLAVALAAAAALSLEQLRRPTASVRTLGRGLL
jgi:phosphatidylglycerol---prolipoprotein diacylglyceryl transferase